MSNKFYKDKESQGLTYCEYAQKISDIKNLSDNTRTLFLSSHSLQKELEAESQEIHKTSLKGPANIVIIPKKLEHMFSANSDTIPFLEGLSKQRKTVPFWGFENSSFLGKDLYGKMLYSTNELEDEILICRTSDGFSFSYAPSDSANMHVNLHINKNKNFIFGQVEFVRTLKIG